MGAKIQLSHELRTGCYEFLILGILDDAFEKNNFPFCLHVCEKRVTFAHVIELVRHIEVLLLESDCVIVPDFGGFTAHRVPATYDREERSFLPPLRTLGFNPQLRINDSLLAQSYITAYDISYPEALRRIADDVSEMKRLLDEEGSFTMSGIGTLTVNMDGNYEFEPCEAGILSPAYYGLSSVWFKQLSDKTVVSQPAPSPLLEEEEPQSVQTEDAPALLDFTDSSDDDDERAISIKMSWLRNAVAIAAAVVAFFLLSTPIANSDLNTTAMSNLQGQLLYKLIPQDTNMLPAEPVAEEATAKSTHAPVVQAKEQNASANSQTPIYYIVLASQVKRSNADMYVEHLHKLGYSDAKVFVHKNIVRVVCGEFSSEADAYSRLSQLHQKEEFEEAWVYKAPTEV